jgi:hypothetical protein
MNTLPVLSKTEFAEKYIGILQPLEAFVAHFYRRYPEMYDLDVLRVYEALLKHIKAELTNFPLPEPKLGKISFEIYDQLFMFLEEMKSSYSLQEIQECLKTLERSLKMWSKDRGSRGYLGFIAQFN